MRSDRLRHLLAAQPPFASVYFDDSHDTEDPTPRLVATCRDLCRQLEQQGAGPELMAVVEHAVLDARPPVGRSGRAIIATAEGVLIDEHVPRPEPAKIVRVSGLPYVLPLVAHSPGTPTYVLAAVDHVGADLTVHHGDTVRTETVEKGGHPVHKAVRADKGEYGEAQQRVDEMRRENIKAVADRATAIVDDVDAEVLFVIGEVRSSSDLVSALPDRIAQRVVELRVGARGSRVDAEVHAAIDAEFHRRRLAEADSAVQRFLAEAGRGSGLAVEGLAPVCSALRDGAVETLIIGDLRDRTVVAGDSLKTIAADPDVLSELGAAPTRTLRADEALPMAAVSIDASLSVIEGGIDPIEGIGALLRYVPGTT